MNDALLFFGGIVLVVIGLMSLFRRDWLWKLYSLEPRWSKRNPERTPEWDVRTKGYAFYFLAFGAMFIVLGF